MVRHLETSALAGFTDEVRDSLPAILTALEAAERDRLNTAATSEAHRLIHALKGAASMVGLAALGYLLNVAEELLEGPLAGTEPLTDELIAILKQNVPRFGQYMDDAMNGRPVAAVVAELATALHRARGATPDERMLADLVEIDTRELASWLPAPETPEAPAVGVDAAPPEPQAELDLGPTEEIDPALAEVFAQEAQEHLQTIARLTSHIANAPEDRDSLQELRRSVHTLKGAAGVVGYKAASKLAHRMEDLLDRLYDGGATMTPEALHVLAASSDALDDLINLSADPVALRATVARLFAEFDVVVGAAAAGAVPAQAPVTESLEAPSAETEPSLEEVPTPVPARDRRRSTGDRRQGLEDRRSGGHMLRVPVGRLNDLVRAVSELVINRSTFEQHYAALLEQVDELKFSAARIRKVAQKLESDYEVRALAGSVVGKAAGYGFDELEFDRYTEFHLLTRELTETANDVATVSSRVSDSIGDFDGDLTRLGRLTREIQDKTMEFRMVALGTLAARLERTVRVTAETCGKLVDFAIDGEHVALDKSLLEQMADPLLHLVRNAVDHGIEMPEVRRATGKPERGRVTVRAYHEGTDVVIEVQDDGAGLDVDRIRRTAIERGLVTEADAAAMAADALYGFVFEPGFSTASRVTEISGRGVGMDIVKSKVIHANGRIQIDSQAGVGTTMSVRVPMTLTITRVLLVRAGNETFGLPLGAVLQIVRPHPTAIGQVGHERVLTLDGRTYPLRDLADALGLPRWSEAPAAQPVLVANLAGRRVALAVDEVLASRDAVVKTLGSHLRRVRGIWGATLLGDGTVVLILNPADVGPADEARVRVVAPRPAVAAPVEQQAYSVLVVDDSLSMRHVLSTAVKKAGWIPVQARDGVDALEVVHRAIRPPDLILLDIEMPRMDGYEFLSTMRSQAAYRDLPIVMLTSRGSDKHREKARALGATDYLVKPFREDALIETIHRLVQAARHGTRRAAS